MITTNQEGYKDGRKCLETGRTRLICMMKTNFTFDIVLDVIPFSFCLEKVDILALHFNPYTDYDSRAYVKKQAYPRRQSRTNFSFFLTMDLTNPVLLTLRTTGRTARLTLIYQIKNRLFFYR